MKLKSKYKEIHALYESTTISVYDVVPPLIEFKVDDKLTEKTDFLYEEMVKVIENEIKVKPE